MLYCAFYLNGSGIYYSCDAPGDSTAEAMSNIPGYQRDERKVRFVRLFKGETWSDIREQIQEYADQNGLPLDPRIRD